MRKSVIEGSLNIIGDIAGEMGALEKLVAKMPKADWVIGVGDLIDRGPNSKDVIQKFMDEPKWESTRGNHEDMLLSEFLRWGRYSLEWWIKQGGGSTLDSYAGKKDAFKEFLENEDDYNLTVYEYAKSLIPEDHIEWMRRMPLFLDCKELLITHAPVRRDFKLSVGIEMDLEGSVLWNRREPIRFKSGKFQVFGHNHNYDEYPKDLTIEEAKTIHIKMKSVPKTWEHNDDTYAICLDTDRANILTGMHWPSGEISQQEY